MSDEKPSSIWKKEISFRRKEAEASAPAAEGGSIWKREISLRKKAKDEAAVEAPAPAEISPPDPELELALAGLVVEPVPVPEPTPIAPPVEHDWLTQPLEVVSEPPAALEQAPMEQAEVEQPPVVSLVPPVEEPPVFAAPVAEEPVVPVYEPLVQEPPVYEQPVFEQPVHVEPVYEEPAAVVLPEPALDLDLGLDLPVGLPELPEPEPVAVAPVALEPEASVADEPPAKVPFYKRELSLKREKAPKAPKAPKAEKPKKEKQEKAPSGGKVPFYKRDISFKRGAKEWDAAEPVAETKPKKEKPAKASRSLPSLTLPTLALPSFGGGRGNSSAKKLVGLKIGGSQIAAARITNGDAPELVQAVREPLEHGIVVGGELRDPEALAEALKSFFAKHKLPKRGVRLGIANNRIGVRTFEVTGIEDPKQLANAIRFRAQEVLPIPIEEAVLDFQVLSEGTTEDGQPLRRVLLVVAYRELVDRYVAACRKAGLQIVGIDLEAFALLRAIAEPHDPVPGSERGALVAVSVGHERSTFAVSDGRVCEFTRVLEWGGWALNVAIARALDLSPSEVEPVKRALSFAGAEELPEGFTQEQLETARDAARKQLQSFARELVSSLQFYQNQPGSLGIGEIAVTGGTAHLPGLGSELERLIGVPVRIADPMARLRVSKKVAEPDQLGSFAVAIGLGIED